MNVEEFPEESDSSDEDYLPAGKPEDVPSEVESDGDSEEPLSGAEDNGTGGKKRNKKSTKKRKKHKVEETIPDPVEEKEDKTEEEKKQEIDDIWADFMKDTGFQSKSTSGSQQKPKPAEKNVAQTEKDSKQNDKVKITQVFEYAGEEVRVEKEVAANSAEARLLAKPSSTELSDNRTLKRGGLSGIGNVLSQLGKKQKISTLEKTKLDWDTFKKEENIEEELQIHNKGKNGYLERQDFLQRADLRRFEIEKEVRSIERSKRLNNL